MKVVAKCVALVDLGGGLPLYKSSINQTMDVSQQNPHPRHEEINDYNETRGHCCGKVINPDKSRVVVQRPPMM